MSFTTKEDVKELLGRSGTDTTDDALLTKIVAGVDGFILSYLDREALETKAYHEFYSGNGGAQLILDHGPVTAVASVKVRGVAIPASVNYSFGYTFDSVGIYLYGYRFDKGLKNVEVDYTGGYASVPADINRAATEIAAMAYERRKRMGVSSKTIGQESISYAAADLTPNARLALNGYRKVFLAR